MQEKNFCDLETTRLGMIGEKAVLEYLTYTYQPPDGTRKEVLDVSDVNVYPEYRFENVDFIVKLYKLETGEQVDEVWHEVKTDDETMLRTYSTEDAYRRSRIENIHEQVNGALYPTRVPLNSLLGTGNLVVELWQKYKAGWYSVYRDRSRKDIKRDLWYYIVCSEYGTEPHLNNIMLRIPFHEFAEVYERNKESYRGPIYTGTSKIVLMPLEDVWKMPRDAEWSVIAGQNDDSIFASWLSGATIPRMPVYTDPSTRTHACLYIDQTRRVEQERWEQDRSQ